jgi:uncharacterized phiE125 gp8 family phage protein
MTLRLITDATAEPVSVADLRLFMRLSTVDTTEDGLLSALEKSARQYAENFTKRACLPQTFRLTMDTFKDEIVLPVAPVSTLGTDIVVSYLDGTSGNSTTLATSVYGIDSDAEPGRIYLKDGQEWPSVWDQRDAVSIQFVAGFKINTAVTPSTDTCPEDIETWIKMRVSQMYEYREAMQPGAISEMPHSYVDGLLDRHVLIDVRP